MLGRELGGLGVGRVAFRVPQKTKPTHRGPRDEQGVGDKANHLPTFSGSHLAQFQEMRGGILFSFSSSSSNSILSLLFLMELPPNFPSIVLCAEMQTAAGTYKKISPSGKTHGGLEKAIEGVVKNPPFRIHLTD